MSSERRAAHHGLGLAAYSKHGVHRAPTSTRNGGSDCALRFHHWHQLWFLIEWSCVGGQGTAQFHGRFSTEIADDESRMQRSGFCGIHTLVCQNPAM